MAEATAGRPSWALTPFLLTPPPTLPHPYPPRPTHPSPEHSLPPSLPPTHGSRSRMKIFGVIDVIDN